jgi:uncharacterized membrane protein
MADLIAITYDTRSEANAARDALSAMATEHLVEVEDAVVAYKDSKGNVRLDQTINVTAAGAAYGGFWGALLGMLFTITAGAPLVPLATAAFGAGFGALSARLTDFGINDEMMRKLASDIDSGKATLFVLAREVTYDKVLHRLAKFRGEVLRTSLPENIERDLRNWLHHAA